MSSDDKLDQMHKQQAEFNKLLVKERQLPDFPLDLSEKASQIYLKTLAHECMHELFEANYLLKNSKAHRTTNVGEFDREAYKEELCDALHYFFGILNYSGISSQELFDAYMKKGEVNIQRIKSGY